MNKKLRALPIGIGNFSDVIEGNYYYVDKTLFIKELIDSGPGKVTLIPRPRRFGKTINMSMLQCFFEKHNAKDGSRLGGQAKALFDGLAISKEAECMAHQGKYPVIFLTFKDIKPGAWESCYTLLKTVIADEYRRHNYLLDSAVLDEGEKEKFRRIVGEIAPQEDYQNALKNLSKYLFNFYNQKAIILIDEYDSPIHAGFLNNYYDKTISFMRGFLCGGLKDNNALAFGVLTGILRVARESIFSGMNNLDVNTLFNDHYADKFGLTEKEVAGILSAYNLSGQHDEVRLWYNGYRVGQCPVDPADKDGEFLKVYNPWSILHFIKNNAVGFYWVNTSDNKLIQDLIQRAQWDFKKDFERILTGESVSKKIYEDTVFTSLETDPNALWSFLVFSGYLTWKSRERMQTECNAELIVPNREIGRCFATLIDRWFSQSKVNEDYQEMLHALATGDIPTFKSMFMESVLESFSCFDVGGRTPERVYHAYVLGMLVGLRETHAVKSNREGGRGRYDVCIIPHDKKQVGTIIEFKVFNKEQDKTMANCAAMAFAQIEEKQYEAELRMHGVTNIIKYAIVFDRKHVLIKDRKA